MDVVHEYSITFESGSWRLMKGLILFVKVTKKDTWYCEQGKALVSNFFVIVETDSDIEPLHKLLGDMMQKGSDIHSSLQEFKGH